MVGREGAPLPHRSWRCCCGFASGNSLAGNGHPDPFASSLLRRLRPERIEDFIGNLAIDADIAPNFFLLIARRAVRPGDTANQAVCFAYPKMISSASTRMGARKVITNA